MISKNYIQNALESSPQHSENIESAHQKREWGDPVMIEVMRATDALLNNGGNKYDGIGCDSIGC